MARMILALAICGAAWAAMPAAAQNENTEAAPTMPMAPPAPYDSPTGSVQAPAAKEAPVVEKAAPAIEKVDPVTKAERPSVEKEAPVAKADALAAEKETPAVEGKAPETMPAEPAPKNTGAAESKPTENAATESKPSENLEGRFTFSRMNDGYVRLDNRTGQVSFCGKRAVGWTCQVAPEDRGVLENEIARVQQENAALKKELLARGLPLPGSMKGEPPVARNEQTFGLPSDANIDRMKVMVEKAWRRLVDMISALQKDVLKKS
jgi:hypothetical protein